MSRSVSLTDLFTYSAFLTAALLIIVDWIDEPDPALRGAAVVLAVLGHHVWIRHNNRRHVDEAVSAVVVEHHLRSLGDDLGARRISR